MVILFVIFMGAFMIFSFRRKDASELENLKNGNFEYLNDDNVKETLKKIIAQQTPETEWKKCLQIGLNIIQMSHRKVSITKNLV